MFILRIEKAVVKCRIHVPQRTIRPSFSKLLSDEHVGGFETLQIADRFSSLYELGLPRRSLNVAFGDGQRLRIASVATSPSR